MKQILTALAFSALLFAPNVAAQSKKELSAQDDALSQRLSVLERRMLTGDPAAERLIQRMDGLEASQRNLTGEIERLRFERDTLRNEVQALIEDVSTLQSLSARMRVHLDAVDLVAKEQGGRGGNLPSQTFDSPGEYPSSDLDSERAQGGTSLSQVPSAPVMKNVTIPVELDYAALQGLPALGEQQMFEGNFAAAQDSFRQYLTALPTAEDAGEVSFWLAETHFVRGAYTDAADQYIASMRKDPNGVKAPEAMVGLAATLRSLGKTAEACQTLASFPSEYPSAASRVRDKARVESARAGC